MRVDSTRAGCTSSSCKRLKSVRFEIEHAGGGGLFLIYLPGPSQQHQLGGVANFVEISTERRQWPELQGGASARPGRRPVRWQQPKRTLSQPEVGVEQRHQRVLLSHQFHSNPSRLQLHHSTALPLGSYCVFVCPGPRLTFFRL